MSGELFVANAGMSGARRRWLVRRRGSRKVQPTPGRDFHKATWFGCGQHIPTVMDQVPEQDRCRCEPKVEKDGKLYPPKADKPN
ncbi:hypothetical protein M432DRAFT_643160 [Thermoascus aurantiacus ATCC 26904]